MLDIEDRDVDQILNMMICDEIIEKTQSFTNQEKYKLTNWDKVQDSHLNQPPLNKIPCGKCELKSECRTGHKISPENCIYFDNFP